MEKGSQEEPTGVQKMYCEATLVMEPCMIAGEDIDYPHESASADFQ